MRTFKWLIVNEQGNTDATQPHGVRTPPGNTGIGRSLDMSRQLSSWHVGFRQWLSGCLLICISAFVSKSRLRLVGRGGGGPCTIWVTGQKVIYCNSCSIKLGMRRILTFYCTIANREDCVRIPLIEQINIRVGRQSSSSLSLLRQSYAL